jgi:hypothetical protein
MVPESLPTASESGCTDNLLSQAASQADRRRTVSDSLPSASDSARSHYTSSQLDSRRRSQVLGKLYFVFLFLI